MTKMYVDMTGSGTVQTTPDVATLRLGVSFPAKTVGAALEGCAKQTSDVLASIRAIGVESRDLQTASLSVDPRWNNDGTEIVGHTASQMLSVRLRDITTVGKVITAAGAAAGNSMRMDSLSWTVADPQPLQVKAREVAFEDARDKAEQLATLAGARVGQVLHIIDMDSSSGWAPPTARSYKMMAGAEMDMPTEGGEHQVSAQVRVRWALVSD